MSVTIAPEQPDTGGAPLSRFYEKRLQWG